MGFLSGYMTYIMVGVSIVTSFAIQRGWLTPAQHDEAIKSITELIQNVAGAGIALMAVLHLFGRRATATVNAKVQQVMDVQEALTPGTVDMVKAEKAAGIPPTKPTA